MMKMMTIGTEVFLLFTISESTIYVSTLIGLSYFLLHYYFQVFFRTEVNFLNRKKKKTILNKLTQPPTLLSGIPTTFQKIN